MAERFLFFNSQLIDGEYDREYQAQDFAEYFGSVLSSGFLSIDGDMGLNTKIEDGTLNTVVAPGKAIIKGHFYENTSDLTLEHAVPKSQGDRIDRVVLRLDLRNESRFVRLKVKEGNTATNPQVPELQRDDFIYELGVATIRLKANTSSLESEDLTDTRLDDDVGGIVNSLVTVPHEEFRRMWDEFFDNFSADIESEWREYLEGVKDLGFTTRIDFNEHVENEDIHVIGNDRNRWNDNLDTYRKSKSVQTFREVEKKRSDNTLFSKSVLSDKSGGNFRKRTYTEYAEDGETIILQETYDLIYDNEGDWTSVVKKK